MKDIHFCTHTLYTECQHSLAAQQMTFVYFPSFMVTVGLGLADPVPRSAVREASVGLLLSGVEVVDLGHIDHPLGHAVASMRY